MPLNKTWPEDFARNLTAPTLNYLTHERGLSEGIIRKYKIGCWKFHITIPIFGHNGALRFFKLARLPDTPSDFPKYTCWPAGKSAELYGWEHLGKDKPDLLVICEGESDRLVLESHGISAVTGTCGANVFLPKWADALYSISNLFICFDRDEAGRKGAEHVAGIVSHAKIVELPEEVGPGGDITDFFVRLGKSMADFRKLLDQSKPLREGEGRNPEAQTKSTKPVNKSGIIYSSDPRIQFIKQNVSLEEIAKAYVPSLKRSGDNLVGRCPFHADTNPSLVIYPDQQRFHCYGCGTYGDVIQFLMEAECLTFPQALEALETTMRQRE